MSDDKIQKLFDIEEVRELRSKYGWCYDQNDLDGLVDLFTDDAVCIFGPYGEWNGKDAIRAGYTGTLSEHGGATMHAVTNAVITVDGDTAHGEYYLVDFMFGAAKENPLKILAFYREDYRREAAGWRISRCEITFIWTEEEGALGNSARA